MPELTTIEVLVDEELEKRLVPGQKTILYVGIKYDYGQQEMGLSYEHYNFYNTFLDMGYSLIYFDYMRLAQKHGAGIMSKMLREAVSYYNPDILFYFHFHDWVRHDVWDKLPTKTIIWLADDSWRYDDTKSVWERFNTIITTDRKGYEKRKAENFDVLLSQWACNHRLYRKLNLPKIHDVTFVGRCHGERQEFVNALRKNGINIKTFGLGWNDNDRRISQTDLIEVYNQSKIALNMSYTSKMDKIQVSARDFEVTGCGSLLLTQESEEIKEYYEPDKEILTYKNVDDAAEQIKQYLILGGLRQQIANKGYNRVLRDHTYEKRFNELSLFP